MRTIDALWQEIGRIGDLFAPEECQNYFARRIRIQLSIHRSSLGFSNSGIEISGNLSAQHGLEPLDEFSGFSKC